MCELFAWACAIVLWNFSSSALALTHIEENFTDLCKNVNIIKQIKYAKKQVKNRLKNRMEH